jgi:NAD+ synthase (glutamine-hydrolysing)
MKISMAQLDPTVGDLEGNQAKVRATLSRESEDGADLVVFPELFLVGYPPLDLLERPWFVREARRAVESLVEFTGRFPQTGLIFGAPLPAEQAGGKPLFNSAVLAQGGRIRFIQHKSLLPTYDVFDELRYFRPAPDIRVVDYQGETLGLSICEDAWNDPGLWPRGSLYTLDPIADLARRGATILINISASPFDADKEEARFRLISRHARRHSRPFIFINQVGANDDLVFDGRSLGLDREGRPFAVCPAFTEHVHQVDSSQSGLPGLYVPQDRVESIHDALVLGLKDYLAKCGFSRAVVGLSGGIDSALTACLAREALGPDNVLGVSMPSSYSSPAGVEDAKALAARLGITLKTVPIDGLYRCYVEALREDFEGTSSDVTEENIQARIRGNILMAFSNKFGYLVLSTGNKSELAVGYCTLYGDMSGGLAVLSDVPKTMVYELAAYINSREALIPQAIIDKPPSAELKPGQLDVDTLPPYQVLDAILEGYVEDLESAKEIVGRGFDRRIVEDVIGRVVRNEYKRKQAAPGLRVTTKAFGTGRRMPIAVRLTGLDR